MTLLLLVRINHDWIIVTEGTWRTISLMVTRAARREAVAHPEEETPNAVVA
jgi:hypothetical protein